MTPENPERLWAYAHREGDIRAETDADLAEQDRGEYGCNPAPVAEYVRKDIVEAALKHLAERLERAEARIADLRAVASRMVCDSIQNYGVSDAFCACVTCQVKGYVGKEGEP